MEILNRVKELAELFADNAEDRIIGIDRDLINGEWCMSILFAHQPSFVDIDKERVTGVLSNGRLLLDMMIDGVHINWWEDIKNGKEIQTAES